MYLCPEIIGCRFLITKHKLRNDNGNLVWMDVPNPVEGTIIGFSKSQEDSNTFQLIFINNKSGSILDNESGSIEIRRFGYNYDDFDIKIHPDDLPRLMAKLRKRFQRDSSPNLEEEISRPELMDFE